MGAKQNRKYPVTVEMLARLRDKLDAGKVEDAACWAAILAATGESLNEGPMALPTKCLRARP